MEAKSSLMGIVRPVPLDVFARPTMMVFPNRSICPHVNDSASPMRIPVSNSTGMRVGRCGVAHCATILGELLKCGIYYQSHQCWEDYVDDFQNPSILELGDRGSGCRSSYSSR